MKDDVDRLKMAVFGEKPNHEDGLVGIVSTHSITLYGTEDNPGGIAKDVRTMKRWVGMACSVVSICAALLVVMEFASKMAPVIRAFFG